jgi:hypothetical protein
VRTRLRGDLLQLKPEERTLLMAPGAGLPLSHFDLQLQFSKCSVDANRKARLPCRGSVQP